MATTTRSQLLGSFRPPLSAARLFTVLGGIGLLLFSGIAGTPAAATTLPVKEQPAGKLPAVSLTCQRMVAVPQDVDMWAAMPHFRPGDCIQTTGGWVPAPPGHPQRLVDHCAAVANGAVPGRVQYGNGRGHLKGGDELFEGDQTGSLPRPAPAQADAIFAGPAYDTIFDYSGDSCLHGEEGADWIHGGSGDALIDGGTGADTLYGGSGYDYIVGDGPTAIPQPRDGSPPTNVDLLDGGAGDDILIAGFGVDEMYGGPGNDLCIGSVGGNPANDDAPPPGSDIWVSTGVDPVGRPTGSWLNKYHGCETIWTKTMAPSGLEALLVVDGVQPPEGATGTVKPSDHACEVPPWARWQLASSASDQSECPVGWRSMGTSWMSGPAQAGPHSLWPRIWTPAPLLPEEELDREAVVQAGSLRDDLQRALATADTRDRQLLEQAIAWHAHYSIAGYPTCGLPTQTGTSDDDYIAGDNDSRGSDRMYGLNGNNRLDGFAGDDCLDGGSGNDVLFGGKGSDVLYGGPGDEHLVGGAENDLLYGGKGNDWLYGGTGDDIIDGGQGINHCFGQSGHDIFINCQYIVSGLDEQTGNWGNVVRY